MHVLPATMPAPRLTLRQWVEDDVDALAAAVAESIDHLRPWMAWIAREPLSRDDRLELLRRNRREWAEGGDVVVGAFLDGQVVGGAGLHRRAGPDTVEVGYWIHADHVRQGYATEITAALTTAAFTVDGIERVEIHHDKANIASAGVPRRLGFTPTGEHPDEIAAPAEVGIDCGWAVTRAAWSARA